MSSSKVKDDGPLHDDLSPHFRHAELALRTQEESRKSLNAQRAFLASATFALGATVATLASTRLLEALYQWGQISTNLSDNEFRELGIDNPAGFVAGSYGLAFALSVLFMTFPIVLWSLLPWRRNHSSDHSVLHGLGMESTMPRSIESFLSTPASEAAHASVAATLRYAVCQEQLNLRLESRLAIASKAFAVAVGAASVGFYFALRVAGAMAS